MYKKEESYLRNQLGKGNCNVLERVGGYLAGGAITSIFTKKDISDFDLYFKDKDGVEQFMRTALNDMWVLAITDKSVTIKSEGMILQLVLMNLYEKAEDIFKDFDFTVCMGAYDFKEKRFVLHDEFLLHNSQRILKFNSRTAFPIMSMCRVNKYKAKGYEISKGEQLRIGLTISNLNIKTHDEAKKQLGGLYGENYDEIIKPEVNKEFDIYEVIEKLESANIDRMQFNDEPWTTTEEIIQRVLSIIN